MPNPFKDRGEAVNGYITAASTPEGQKYGYVFNECKLTSDAANETYFLGRPWRNHAKVIFLDCLLGAHIHRKGWDDWDKPEAHRTICFAELNNSGAGADRASRVNWSVELSSDDRNLFTVREVLKGEDGWNP